MDGDAHGLLVDGDGGCDLARGEGGFDRQGLQVVVVAVGRRGPCRYGGELGGNEERGDVLFGPGTESSLRLT